MGVTREMAEGLRAKYAQMLAMRLADGMDDPDGAHARDQMADIAFRFPGALREIDDLELGEIRSRIRGLDAVLHGSAEGEPWMEAIAVFHGLARGALAVKRWLDGRREVDSALQRAFASEVASLPFPEEARSWAGDLARVAAPPRGRLMDLVFARLAEHLGTTNHAARRLVFGVRARRAGRVSRKI